MSEKTEIFLISFRGMVKQRAHFAIFVPSRANTEVGTMIHVVGAPMAGFKLEFKRNYSPAATKQKHEIFRIGSVEQNHIQEHAGTERSTDDTPKGDMERVASQLPPPKKSHNFLAPVNNTNNRRCQEWTKDYVQKLVDNNIIESEAAQIVESKRDHPSHGIFGLGGGGAGEGQAGPAGQ